MKRSIILAICALFIGVTASAQFTTATNGGSKKSGSSGTYSQGTMYVGGGLTFGAGSSNVKMSANGLSESYKSPNPAEFTIAPSFGYFVADNLRVSLSLNYGISSQTDKNDNYKATESSSSFLIGPEVAYYIRIADNLYYTPELGIYGGVTGNKEKYTSDNHSSEEKANAGTFGFGLSLAQVEFRPTPKLGFAVNVMNLKYFSKSKTETEKISDTEELKIKYTTGSFNFNFNATFAVRYYF